MLDKTKFLVPQELTMSQFVTIIRNRMSLAPHSPSTSLSTIKVWLACPQPCRKFTKTKKTKMDSYI